MDQTWQLISQVGPTGLVAMALVFTVREWRKRNEQYDALQETRVNEAKANATAMLTVYEKVEKLIDRLEELRK